MNIEQLHWQEPSGWQQQPSNVFKSKAQVVFIFSSVTIFKEERLLQEVRGFYPNATLFGCTTAGEICGTNVTDDSCVVTAIEFEKTLIETRGLLLSDVTDSLQAGERLGISLPKKKLRHVIVLSDGLKVNGSALVAGLTRCLPPDVTVTGGLSGDGDRFKETYVLWNGMPHKDAIAVLGLYGDHLKVGYGSLGGWDSFGPERLITKSRGNVLYELDGKSALELYKKYLGEHAQGLPSTGLLFPLSLRSASGENGVVRTILSVNEEEQSMTFAGDIPAGWYARLMKANFDRLIDGAIGAAKTSYHAIDSDSPDFALLISCVGRKLVLKQRVEEEVEGVREVLGTRSIMTGFYSYGEISPFTPSSKCALHNQTMTITTLSE